MQDVQLQGELIPNEQVEFFLLPVSLRQNLLDYLGGRPFSEVEQGVMALRNLQPCQNPKDSDKSAEPPMATE